MASASRRATGEKTHHAAQRLCDAKEALREACYDERKRAPVSADEAVRSIKSGDHVFAHGASATPTPLLEALCRRQDLQDVTLYHLHTMGPAPWLAPEAAGRFRTALAAAHVAKTVIAEVNRQMPRTLGHTTLPSSKVTAFIETDRPLHEPERAAPSAEELAIGAIIADLVEDGACLQMGIGAIPDAVLAKLTNKNDLGVRTEMFSDGLLPLLQRGVVTNKRKKVHAGRTVTSFVMGSRAVFDYVDDNQLVEFHPCDRTNDPSLIAKNDRVTAINSAIEVDLSGQVCADSMGYRIYSGIGGQMDFIRAAARSAGGKPIIALPSTAKAPSKGNAFSVGGRISRIVMGLKEGAGVVTTRGHVRYVATEHGVVDLHGCTLHQRAEPLISIAHPDFRPELKQQLAQARSIALS